MFLLLFLWRSLLLFEAAAAASVVVILLCIQCAALHAQWHRRPPLSDRLTLNYASCFERNGSLTFQPFEPNKQRQRYK